MINSQVNRKFSFFQQVAPEYVEKTHVNIEENLSMSY